ncbi:alpha/beta fold hydrolase [Paenibacillus sp. RC84]|uniref:alpha/beta fold hydrolase n=1 Tax=Paenibacillus sp. RC84 TaxID=3156252 RepID=UPI0035188FF6
MKETHFHLNEETEMPVFVYRWEPERGTPLRGVVQIAHGMAEHALRYKRFAEKLTARGYIVYASDHRGHGRTAAHKNDLGYPGPDGFAGMTDDMIDLGRRIHEEQGGLPLYLIGHSMGSFLSQKVMYRAPQLYAGVALLGTNGPKGAILKAGILLAKMLVSRSGDRVRSRFLSHTALGSFNRPFRPNRTEFDWLSTDEAEVDKFVKDPLCGYICTTGFFKDFFIHLSDIHLKRHMRSIPKHLPVLLLAGDKDPVGGQGKGVRRLAALYRKLGLEQVDCKLYENKRHEILNEVNREEVMEDVISWLDSSRGLIKEPVTS